MKTYRSIALLVAVLLVISLVSCVRPIPGTTNETQSSTDGSGVPPAGATDVMEQIYLFATQTVLATQGLTSGVPSGLETSTSLTPGAVSSQPVIEPPLEVTPSPEPIIAPTATPGRPATYKLRTGEFPFCIARRFDVDPGALLKANGLNSYSVYFAGMELTIPQNAAAFPGNRSLQPHPATYTVRPGDTLFTIACVFGDVDPDMIAYVNGLEPNSGVSSGQVLNIP